MEESVFIFVYTNWCDRIDLKKFLNITSIKKPALKTFLWEMFDGKKSVGENTFVTAD